MTLYTISYRRDGFLPKKETREWLPDLTRVTAYAMGNSSSQSQSSNASGQETTNGELSLSLLSWNIDGLDKNYTVERALAVCSLIQSHKPDVVFLQEIVPSTLDAFTNQLDSTYAIYHGQLSFHYYPILMVRKGSSVVPQGDLEVLKFPQSQQGRHLLQLQAKFHGVDIRLMTSHLESMNHNTAERKNQLRTVFTLMGELQASSIFGGDLNLLDKEVGQVGLPETFVDVWESCGSDFKQKCTWESCEPRLRLDRIYFCPNESKLQPTKFRLVGNSLLREYRMYPSDHLGLWAEFTLKEC